MMYQHVIILNAYFRDVNEISSTEKLYIVQFALR